MTRARRIGHHERVAGALRGRAGAVAPALVFVAGCGIRAGIVFGPSHAPSPGGWATQVGLFGFPVVLGYLLRWRVPASPVGPALAWVGAAPAAVYTFESWGETLTTAHPWPAAELVYTLKLGAWVWNLAGFVWLCLVFPDGLLPGRRWRAVVGWAVAAGLFLNAALSFFEPVHSGDQRPTYLFVTRVPAPVFAVIGVTGFGGVLAVLAAGVVSLVLRYRRGSELVRGQLRWLMLGAGSVPVLLAGGWLAEMLGVPVGVAYTGFLVAMAALVPSAIAVAVWRHDLLDVDRLLGASLSWLLTTLVSAAVFAVVVYGTADLVGAGTQLGPIAAAFVTAMCLLPLHRLVNDLVGQLVDRERTVMLARVGEFVQRVRDGTAEPEEAEDMLRSVLGDPKLRLLVRLPTSPDGAYVDLAGTPVDLDAGAPRVRLLTGDSEMGALVLGARSARGLRRARDVAVLARLPIEVSRLRLELRLALDDARASRERLALATAAERARLARDLHDGAQQHLIAVGMRLRSVQRELDPAQPAHRDLDVAVSTLADTVGELRRLAHGVRPSRLDDGLATAIKALAAQSPVPVEIDAADVDVSEAVATTAYFVVAEALTNALKHAQASAIRVAVTRRGTTGLSLEVSDDGVGGARGSFGLTSIRDRVAALGGELTLASPAGGGTRLEVTL
ncbi:histidine kinase [Pseudofrankia sp. BMG5.37]|uniref:sensor histidine kinase n=1 Tax=Pseudofrankia sp. BMG5.37 TaxID=3050035 RepID=UPI002895A1AD|nr:histidine kinase [Pseudofrankia sp. BMG5.37]MDT3442733.1 histidine kinase [Pseudofrankia sp. BMG5.37]